MAALQPFVEALERTDIRIDLARSCLLIAEDVYPRLDIDGYLAELERMAMRLRERLPKAAGVEDRIVGLNQFLFDELGFAGNADTYYDPRNSYLNEVIDRRTGIPITLSVVYMEIGRRIGLPLEGVSFPGHFLVRMRLRGNLLVLDPFAGGMPLADEDLRDCLQRVIPEGATGGLAVSELPLEQFLEPASNRQILARLLRNLKGIYREADDPARLLDVLNRMLVVVPEASGELRDRGLVYERLECHRAALQDLSDYLAREPAALDAPEIRARTIDLAALCARLN